MIVVGNITKLLVCDGCGSVIEFDTILDKEEVYQINTGHGISDHINCPRCCHMININDFKHKDVIKIDSDIPQAFIEI